MAIITGFALTQTSVLAQSTRTAEQIYQECGIGGMLFGDSNPLGAVISNVTWDLGTTAMSSNISSEGNCVAPEVENMAFIHNSYNAIVADSAKGNGKYLQSLAKISNKTTEDIRVTIKSLVAVSGYTAQTQAQKANNLYDAIM